METRFIRLNEGSVSKLQEDGMGALHIIYAYPQLFADRIEAGRILAEHLHQVSDNQVLEILSKS